MKQLRWAPGTKKDLRELEEDVRVDFGYGLYLVQEGRPANEVAASIAGLKVKPLSGLGSLVLEFKLSAGQGTYRCVYTVRFQDVVYVLHAFKKKSKAGIGLPKEDEARVREHLKWAEEHYRLNPVEDAGDGEQAH